LTWAFGQAPSVPPVRLRPTTPAGMAIELESLIGRFRH
jgi:hypothetical protein